MNASMNDTHNLSQYLIRVVSHWLTRICSLEINSSAAWLGGHIFVENGKSCYKE